MVATTLVFVVMVIHNYLLVSVMLLHLHVVVTVTIFTSKGYATTNKNLIIIMVMASVWGQPDNVLFIHGRLSLSFDVIKFLLHIFAWLLW